MEDVIFERSFEALDAVAKLAEGASEPAVIEECIKHTRQLFDDIKSTGGLTDPCKPAFAEAHQAIENLRWQLFLKSDQWLPCVAEVIKKTQNLRSAWITNNKKRKEVVMEKSKRSFKKHEWYHSKLSRESAESVLNKKTALTFLVRKSSQERKLAVSYVSDVDSMVHHVLVSYDEAHFWLDSDGIKYASLAKLVEDRGLRIPYSRKQLRKEFPHLAKSKKSSWKPLYEGNIEVGIEIMEEE